MNNGKTIVKLRNLSFFFGALAVIAGALFADNLLVVIRWWSAFAAVHGDSAALAEAGVHGLAPWLDWAAVDYSCATTFIPFLGFLLASRALGRAASAAPAGLEFFPYFRAYDSFNVALGLIGTLWGIILIGFFKMDTVGMGDLMTCLHTALFSTLMAVVWVYLIDHPLLRPWLRGAVMRAYGEAVKDEDAEADEILARLNESARGLNATWRDSASSLETLRAAIEKARAETENFADAERSFSVRAEKLDAAYARLAELTARIAESAERAQTLQNSFAAAAEKLRGERDSLSAELTDVRKASAEEIGKARDDAAVQARRAEELEGSLSAARKSAEDALARMKRDEEDYAKRLAALRDENAELASGGAAARAEAAAAAKRAESAEAEADRLGKLVEKIRSVFS